MSDILQEIRDLQYSDKGSAEALLLSFMQETLPFGVTQVELTPLAVSLNSFNGFLTQADGTRRFFKTHTESDTIIDEYYNAGMLADAGYPVIQPIFKSTEPGKQMLIYEVIDDQSVFDVAWTIETGVNSSSLEPLTQAQMKADQELLNFYKDTLTSQSAAEAAQAPIHQLFYHRLAGGRLERFYGAETHISLPNGTHSLAEVRQRQWTINGQEYAETLDELMARAIQLLNPAQSGPAVIGHGDAHNGNVFLRSTKPPSLLYFDPAFAGRHHPLLDLVKPIFHNVFAMWMYFPREKQASTTISMTENKKRWHVNYQYDLPEVRQMFLRSKFQQVVKPLLHGLHSADLLRADWRTYFKLALMCCPLLTMNLAESERFPPEIALLGLAMSIEMGSESNGKRSLIDQILDDAAATLN